MGTFSQVMLRYITASSQQDAQRAQRLGSKRGTVDAVSANNNSAPNMIRVIPCRCPISSATAVWSNTERAALPGRDIVPYLPWNDIVGKTRVNKFACVPVKQ